MASESPYHVVVIGSSFSGLFAAHKLLKSKHNVPIKVTMLATSSHFAWWPGAPRAMFTNFPGELSDSFIEVAPGFSKYPAGSYEFIQGTAKKVDLTAKTIQYVAVKNEGDADSSEKSLSYDSVIFATGSKGSDPLYSYQGTHVASENRYKQIQADLVSASNILIVGGGSAGVETAGEIGYLNKQNKWGKNVTILSGAERLLPRLRPAIGKRAEEILADMGVTVVHKVQIKSAESKEHGKTDVVLTNGETKKVEILIQAIGRKAVSDYLPSEYTEPKSAKIIVDEFNRVKGAKNAWAVGDVSSTSASDIISINMGTPGVVANVLQEVEKRGGAIDESKGKKFSPLKAETQMVPVGPQKGVGAIFGWWLPSFLCWLIKGRNLMFPKAKQFVDGSAV